MKHVETCVRYGIFKTRMFVIYQIRTIEQVWSGETREIALSTVYVCVRFRNTTTCCVYSVCVRRPTGDVVDNKNFSNSSLSHTLALSKNGSKHTRVWAPT